MGEVFTVVFDQKNYLEKRVFFLSKTNSPLVNFYSYFVCFLEVKFWIFDKNVVFDARIVFFFFLRRIVFPDKDSIDNWAPFKANTDTNRPHHIQGRKGDCIALKAVKPGKHTVKVRLKVDKKIWISQLVVL